MQFRSLVAAPTILSIVAAANAALAQATTVRAGEMVSTPTTTVNQTVTAPATAMIAGNTLTVGTAQPIPIVSYSFSTAQSATAASGYAVPGGRPTPATLNATVTQQNGGPLVAWYQAVSRGQATRQTLVLTMRAANGLTRQCTYNGALITNYVLRAATSTSGPLAEASFVYETASC